jgi:glyoxylate reductase
MSKPRLFITSPTLESALDRLAAIAEVEMNPDASRALSRDELLEGVRWADILYAMMHDRIDRDVVEANPALKGICTSAVNTLYIDVAAASARKIPVTIVPHIVVVPTADQCMALLLSLARRTVAGDRLVRSGVFPGGQSNYLLGSDVTGKTLALIGGGSRNAQEVARRARGFDMRVVYWARSRLPAEEETRLGMTYVPFDQAFAEGDFVSLHAALTPETHHQVGGRELALMKPTAYLINTARGPIVDEAALVSALQAGTIAGAGLDVFEFEPNVSPELLSMDNVVLTPHLGSATRGTRERMANLVADNIIAVVEGRRPPDCVNPEVFGTQASPSGPVDSVPGVV